ncbi:hypothetical protein EEB14_55455 [Rhodococcus sp. WS4]|nr:hypothetical protein EEB14_55455 [Rhodococcus sp. WS4]
MSGPRVGRSVPQSLFSAATPQEFSDTKTSNGPVGLASRKFEPPETVRSDQTGCPELEHLRERVRTDLAHRRWSVARVLNGHPHLEHRPTSTSRTAQRPGAAELGDHLGCHGVVAFLGGTLGELTRGRGPNLPGHPRRRPRAGRCSVDRSRPGKGPHRTRTCPLRRRRRGHGVVQLQCPARLNRELKAGWFRLSRFAPVAVWDAENHWIKMRLRAFEGHSVLLRALDLEIASKDADLRTEISARSAARTSGEISLAQTFPLRIGGPIRTTPW